jgi:hypothetical protein
MLSAEIARVEINSNLFAPRSLTQEPENLINFSSVLNSHGIPHEFASNGSLAFPELSREQLIHLYLLANQHNQPEVAAWALRDANNIDDIHISTTITRESVLAIKRFIKALLLGEEVWVGNYSSAEELFQQIAQRISRDSTLSRFLNTSSRFTEFLRLVEVATSEDPTEEAITQVSSLIVSIFITKSLAGSAAALCGIAAAPVAPPIGPAIASFSCAAIVGIGIHLIVERVVAVIVGAILESHPNLGLKKENLNQLFTRFLTDVFTNFERGINFSSLGGLLQLGSHADTLYSATTQLNQERNFLLQANQYQTTAGLIMSALWRGVFESQENCPAPL